MAPLSFPVTDMIGLNRQQLVAQRWPYIRDYVRATILTFSSGISVSGSPDLDLPVNIP